MTYTIPEIIGEVRLATDMNVGSKGLTEFGDTETLNIDRIIESKIADAARAVTQSAPARLLDGGEGFAESIGWFETPGNGGGLIYLPSDFLRLVVFQMSDWAMPVREAIDETSPEYAMQSSPYPGIKGNPQKPVVALVQHPLGLTLEFYSCRCGEGATVKLARYIPVPEVRNGKIDICEKLKPAVVYYTAYLTALTLQENDLAAAMLNNCKELMK